MSVMLLPCSVKDLFRASFCIIDLPASGDFFPSKFRPDLDPNSLIL